MVRVECVKVCKIQRPASDKKLAAGRKCRLMILIALHSHHPAVRIGRLAGTDGLECVADT